MVRLTRKPARKVYVANKLVTRAKVREWKDYGKKEQEIAFRIKELDKADQIVGKIQQELDRQLEEVSFKQKTLSAKEEEIEKFSKAWQKLNNVRMSDLSDEEIKRILPRQKGFIKELLESHIASKERERDLIESVDEAIKAIDEIQKQTN